MRWKFTDVSEDNITSIFRVEAGIQKEAGSKQSENLLSILLYISLNIIHSQNVQIKSSYDRPFSRKPLSPI
jgi:hypothetical protein